MKKGTDYCHCTPGGTGDMCYRALMDTPGWTVVNADGSKTYWRCPVAGGCPTWGIACVFHKESTDGQAQHTPIS